MKIINMRAVLLCIFLLILISASKAECTMNVLSCSNNSEPNLTFEPSEDKIDGRYKVDWCTHADKDDMNIEWKLTLKYFNISSNSSMSLDSLCRESMKNNGGIPPDGSSHSLFNLPVTIDLNCTLVCFSTTLDLVFTNHCYHIKTSLHYENPNKSDSSNDSFHYIINNSTLENFQTVPYGTHEFYEDRVLVNWYLGHVPATRYSVEIRDNQTNPQYYDASCNVTGELQSEVSCEAQLPPGLCYRATLHHEACWTSTPSLFKSITNIDAETFCVPIPDVPVASSSPKGEITTAVGTTAIVLLVLVVLCAVRRHRIVAWQRRVLDRWLETTRAKPTLRPGVGGDILLLYARDCAQFERAAQLLGALVHRATGRRVIDVYSGESTRLWAPAGDEWLRLMLARDDTRVLLLQSPAGALHAADLAESRTGPALVPPSLGSLVSWRRPHAGDALLSLALRHLTAAPEPEPYRKHYVANITGLGADMSPGVTPQRRYTLPDAVSCLLRDLAPDLKFASDPDARTGPDTEPGLRLAPKLIPAPVLDIEPGDFEPLLLQFMEAADEFADHVRAHPDYLADELLFK